MKKFLLLSIFAIFVIADVFPQAIYNSGKIELTLRTYGRIRIGMVDNLGAAVRQLDRGSLLYYMLDTNVYDYLEDTDDIMAPFARTK